MTTIALLVLASLSHAQELRPASPPAVAQLLGAFEAGYLPPAPTRAAGLGLETLIARAGTGPGAARREAIAALGRPEHTLAIPHLGTIVLAPDEALEVRVAAALALGRMRNWRAVGFLKDSVRDAEKELRFASAIALGQTKGREALALLISALETDADWWVRFAAAAALGDNRDPRALKALSRAAEAETEWQVRLQAVRSLGQMGSKDAALALGRALKHPDPATRGAAAMSLQAIGGLDSLNILSAALPEEKENLPRQSIAEAIEKILARR